VFSAAEPLVLLSPADQAALCVLAAAALDRAVGDPRWCLHPVVVMGWCIGWLRHQAECWASDRPLRLRLAGVWITTVLVLASGTAGWGVERLALWSGSEVTQLVFQLPLLLGLASALAGRSLEQAVHQVLQHLKEDSDVPAARQALSWIVGRNTSGLSAEEIVRAAAETSSENAVDGLFAPLFWMLIGVVLWSAGAVAGPGPLALAWGFKAASTLDSMLGYRRGRLQWLGTAGARLDDALVWLPCRLVALTLPLVAGCNPHQTWRLQAAARRDGAPDPSPNAGVSQAIYAHVVGVQLGGMNRYGDQLKAKPILAAGCSAPTAESVAQMLQLTLRLELLWLAAALAAVLLISSLQ
jgi:adenosylcobinamide-phosphate synthase